MIFKKLWKAINLLDIKIKLILATISIPVILAWFTTSTEWITAKSNSLPVLGCGSMAVLLLFVYILVNVLIKKPN